MKRPDFTTISLGQEITQWSVCFLQLQRVRTPLGNGKQSQYFVLKVFEFPLVFQSWFDTNDEKPATP